VRVRAALAGGADLVVCLPAPYAVCSAEGFAAAGVATLDALGCVQTLAFGAETPDTALLLQTAQLLQSDAFAAAFAVFDSAGQPFAAARAQVAEQLQAYAGALLSRPNNILGVEYCKAILAQNSALTPLALPRKGAQHDEALRAAHGENALPQSGLYASATALRELAHRKGVDALAAYVPPACCELYRQAHVAGAFTQPRAFDIALLSRLRAMTPEQLAQIRGVNEGLEHRLARAVQQAASAAELYTLLKTKRYAHARLRRLALDAALGYTSALPALPPYVHVLAANPTGLQVLRTAKHTARLPLDTSLARLAATSAEAKTVAQAHAAAEDFAALCCAAPRPMGIAYTQKFLLAEG
jgi:predicted nucleotidyltransferase